MNSTGTEQIFPDHSVCFFSHRQVLSWVFCLYLCNIIAVNFPAKSCSAATILKFKELR